MPTYTKYGEAIKTLITTKTLTIMQTDYIKEMAESYNKIMPLEAIWITNPAPIIEGGKKARLTEGMKLKVVDGAIVDMKEGEIPTHIITSCKGNVMGTVLIMVVMDLKTQELTEIKL